MSASRQANADGLAEFVDNRISGSNVCLRVVEDLEGGTAIELYLAAPEGLTGSVIVDVGLVEV